MHRAVRFLLVFTIAFMVGCSRDPESQSARLVESGNKFFDKGKFKEAGMQYRRAISKFPKNGPAYYKLGLVSLKLGDIGTAAKSFQRSIDLKNNLADSATKLADIYWAAYTSDPVKYKSLKPEMQTLVDKLDANSFDGARLAGYLALADSDLDGALAKFQKADSIKRYQPELSMSLLQTLFAKKRFDDAEKLAKDFLAHVKDFSPMYDQLFLYYASQNRLSDGEQLLKSKVANNPLQQDYHLQLAGFYMASQRPADLEATLQKVTSNPKDFPLGHLAVGRFFRIFRNFDRARREYEEGMKATPKEKAAYQKALVELLATQNKSDEARAIIDDVLKNDPKDSQAIEMRSSLKLQTGNPGEIQAAVNDLQGLVTKNPENPYYRYELGRALVAKNFLDQAKVQLEESIRLRPDLAPPKLMIVRILSSRNDHAKALQYCDDVLKTEPANLEARLLRANALAQIGERAKARTELEAMLKAAPNQADARFQLGLINWQEKNYKQAEAIFRQLQESNPGDNRGLIGLIETYTAQNDFKSAIGLVQDQLKKDPNRQDFQLAMAKVLIRAERYDEGIAQFKQLIAKNPNSASLEMLLAESYRLKGDVNGAIDAFRKASQLAPNDGSSLTKLAMLLDGIGRRTEAKPIYEQALKLKPDDVVALNNLAFIKAEEGTDLDNALSLAQRARQAMPSDLNVADTLGWVYIKKNLSEQAVQVFQELTSKQPEVPTFHYHLAMALAQKGDKVRAKKSCELALQKNPSKEEATKIKELMAKIG